jgi:hypothetical protein
MAPCYSTRTGDIARLHRDWRGDPSSGRSQIGLRLARGALEDHHGVPIDVFLAHEPQGEQYASEREADP